MARVALYGSAVRGDDVADHPRHLDSPAAGHELEGLRIGDRDHVRLLDRVEAGDRRSVESHAVVERALELGHGDREALQVPLDVREPQMDEPDVLVLDPLQISCRLAGSLVARPLVPPVAIEASLNENSPGRGTARGHVASTSSYWSEPCTIRPGSASQPERLSFPWRLAYTLAAAEHGRDRAGSRPAPMTSRGQMSPVSSEQAGPVEDGSSARLRAHTSRARSVASACIHPGGLRRCSRRPRRRAGSPAR